MTKIIIDTEADTKLEAKVKKILEEKNIGYKILNPKDKSKIGGDDIFRKELHERAVEAIKRFKRVSIKW